MRHRLIWLAVLASTMLLGAVAASASSAAADPGQLTILGPWQGRDATSFQAVLSGFMQANPGITVTYKPVAGDVAAAVPTSSADLAVLSLPTDQGAMATMERSGILKPIDFAAPAVSANYAYSWKLLGSVDGKLTGLAFDGTFDSVASDFGYQPTTRAIHVDVRYLLWVLDAVEKADSLLAELGVRPQTPR